MEIIGHRGAKGLAPENTIAGIKFALSRGVDWIEFDVRSTKDGKLVVVHDHTLLRVAKNHRRVQNLTFAELREIATVSGEAIPTFEEVMETIGRRAKIDIELKSRRTAKKVVAEIKQQVDEGRPYSDFIVSSFKSRLLQEVQRLDSQVPLLLLQEWLPFKFMLTPRLRLFGVGFYRLVAPKIAINLARKRGLWTMVYTVNTKAEANIHEQRGIHAIVTDVPQAFKPLWRVMLLWALIALGITALLYLLVRYVI
jgi:glycerophosphoryl diester phosphodiesterase